MTESENTFHKIGTSLGEATQGKLFGKLCYKIGKKAFICFFEDEMVFKLKDQTHQEALDLSGSQLFDPSKKNRPMKEWVQVSFDHKDKWASFAESALAYVSSMDKK